MKKPTLPNPPRSQENIRSNYKSRNRRRMLRRNPEKSDVLVSAVISSYLLTHLHHILQNAEYGATKKGHQSQAANFAQLRKVLCMDARSMEDASAVGTLDSDLNQIHGQPNESNAA